MGLRFLKKQLASDAVRKEISSKPSRWRDYKILTVVDWRWVAKKKAQRLERWRMKCLE